VVGVGVGWSVYVSFLFLDVHGLSAVQLVFFLCVWCCGRCLTSVMVSVGLWLRRVWWFHDVPALF
jgi:hypothetical protein